MKEDIIYKEYPALLFTYLSIITKQKLRNIIAESIRRALYN